MMTKWDTIQEDIKDAYAHLDDVEEELEEVLKMILDEAEKQL